jgi:hypothetical protein
MKFLITHSKGFIVKLKIRTKNKYDWHQWFAWYPVVVKEPEGKYIVWLQNVSRMVCKDSNGDEYTVYGLIEGYWEV